MKKYFLSLLLLFSLRFTNAQITVTQDDFADAYDTARMSLAIWNPFLDFGSTGANFTWDFSDLQWQSQYIDTFLNPIFINPIYGFAFSNFPLNPYRSNVAKKADNTLTTFPLLSGIFTDGYNFYYKSPTLYRQRGIGMRVSGFPTSVPMTHSDTIYRFPMNFGDEDSSWSDYTAHIPQIGTYSHKQHRVNKVDGWGTLTTPFGTFDVLRQVSDIRGSDSLYIDTLNFGFKLDNDIQREYKWIANRDVEPLLQIYTQAGILGQFQNFEFVTKIVYRDSIRFLPTGISELLKAEMQFRVFPNPASGNFTIISSPRLNNPELTITDIWGRTILTKPNVGTLETINAGNWERGIYLLTLRSGNQRSVERLAIQ